ncbi:MULTISPECIES: 5-methyltetrahydropteroyltriglutamate--homocysteine S-methyltransferase [Deefgea]|uniref:5-methyltetrahydropteroyltriglutamate--homocysteine methyltransferase n=1 Tax=Deefgea chitinilytica TaxID=570276 RepID=A0ABS2CBD8_9NEIS|nr:MULTISPECIES: 5-methyltetrahydropteroyltriglutamate--homocysteine S-methyltransferase [Deefgea]MBM5571474.1 5-methyltetrahydropteroyltriglutamate--homocysteine S-methyltransferase [Deefgea chitinilytica]MBM9888707.1 5-methyltetrahydropteroyltriglutamate--homocysteine S-methyltransferase [Deefgea sp. CFH1-16]
MTVIHNVTVPQNVKTHILGFPRIGAQRELKFATEKFWRGEITEAELVNVGQTLRRRHWAWQAEAGLDFVTVGDFAWYDQILNAAALLGCLPARFGFDAKRLTLAQYFELARGNAAQPALEMTKYFDTNYHYLVPELSSETTFDGGVEWFFHEIDDAQTQGHAVKAVLPGPLTFLWLAKSKQLGYSKLDHLPKLLDRYTQVLQKLAAKGVKQIQLDEPILGLELPTEWIAAFAPTYQALAGHGLNVLVATYFDSVESHAQLLADLPVAGVHLDLVRAPEQLPAFIALWPRNKILSLGVIDGRNIWAADLGKVLVTIQEVKTLLGQYLWIAPSCSLLHTPVDLAQETQLDTELKSWLAFAKQKLAEISVLKRALNGEAVAAELAANAVAQAHRRSSPRIHNPAVAARLAALPSDADQRISPFAIRQAAQRARFNLPLLPTTTIGSFPQTSEIRAARAAFKQGKLSAADYDAAMKAEIALVVRKQDELGIDVPVHGEAERNDMVEYFGEQLAGFAFTQFGWVQSYGSRCVKPPVLFGDVSRPQPMTVAWSSYAQSLTAKPMKGMLTGPVTILQWSFVRDDQPRSLTCQQIALAIRDEVVDLENAGIGIIQIDEPAFREGLPLKQSHWAAYLAWAGEAFRISASGVANDTQIHTHMCYSEFNDILPEIAAMDADVITIETSRSDMELLEAFGEFKYPNEIGPGVYDIHSPRVPTVNEMLRLIAKALDVVPADRLWINPDCGLKTRAWPETEAALVNMLQATQTARSALAEGKALVIESRKQDPVIAHGAGCACH